MLKFEVDESGLGALDESVRGFYEKRGDVYRLKVEGIDPADELKEALKKERNLKSEVEKRLSQIEQERRQQEEESLKKSGEFKKLYESEAEKSARLQRELEEERETRRKERQAVQQEKINSETLKICSTVAVDDSSLELLAEKMRQFAIYTDEGIQYEIGGVKVTREKVIDMLSNKYPRLVKGSGASGGGATGGVSGGAGKTFAQMSEAERVELYKRDPETYRRLKTSGA